MLRMLSRKPFSKLGNIISLGTVELPRISTTRFQCTTKLPVTDTLRVWTLLAVYTSMSTHHNTMKQPSGLKELLRKDLLAPSPTWVSATSSELVLTRIGTLLWSCISRALKKGMFKECTIAAFCTSKWEWIQSNSMDLDFEKTWNQILNLWKLRTGSDNAWQKEKMIHQFRLQRRMLNLRSRTSPQNKS